MACIPGSVVPEETLIRYKVIPILGVREEELGNWMYVTLESKAVVITLGFLLKKNCKGTLKFLQTKVEEGGRAKGCVIHWAAHNRSSVNVSGRLMWFGEFRSCVSLLLLTSWQRQCNSQGGSGKNNGPVVCRPAFRFRLHHLIAW